MKILVLGSGLMGPAVAFNAMSDPQVSHVALCDMSQQQLDAAQAKLGGMEGGEKLATVALDLSDQAATVALMADFDAIVAALPRAAIPFGIRAAVAAERPLIDLDGRAEKVRIDGIRLGPAAFPASDSPYR